MNPEFYQKLLQKYLKGECTEAEKAWVEGWYVTLPEKENTVEDELSRQKLLERNWQQIRVRTIENPTSKRLRWMPYGMVAALAVVILALVYYWLTPKPFAYQSAEERIEFVNTSLHQKRIVLPDESVVTLQPGGSLEYPRIFKAHTREVRLIGEAFFEIQKNPHKPFLVHTRQVTARVLGTSFWVRAHQNAPTASVEVRTGKVAVYRSVHSDTTPAEVIVTPNQQVNYAAEQFTKTIVARPALLLEKKQSFTFQNTSLEKIIQAMEASYGIEILYDRQAMASCFVTTSLEQESLFEKLDILCKLLGATYKVVDAKIMISGPGCS
ncbi:MAG: FecR domain-containing protein [Siphonobacter sp.]